MVRHAFAVEELHLLLNSPEDARVAGVQADYEVSAVVVLLHELALLLQRHVGRRAYDGSGLMARGERLGHQRTGIEYEVGPLQHPTTPDADEFRIARPGTDYLDVPILTAQMLAVDGQCCRPVLAFHLGDNQFAAM